MANFPGAAGYYVLGDITTARFQQASVWSFGCFFRAEATATVEHAILGKWGSTNLRQIVVEIAAAAAPAAMTAVFDNGSLTLTSSASIQLNTWYFVSVTNATGTNGLVLRLIAVAAGASEINAQTGTHPADRDTLTQPIEIGSRRTGDHGFDGDICWPFYISGKALSLAELQAIVEQNDADRGTTILGHETGGVAVEFLYDLEGDATEQDLGSLNHDATETGVTGVATGDRPPDLGAAGGTDNPVTNTDNAEASDTPAADRDAPATASDAAEASDAPATLVAYRPVVTDSAVASDAPNAGANVSSADTAVASDGSSVQVAWKLTVSDIAEASDAPSGAMSYTASASDIAVASENFDIGVGSPIEAENALASDTLAPAVGYHVVGSDSAVASDGAVGETGGEQVGTVSDSAVASDALAVLAALEAAPSDGATASDALDVQAAIEVLLSEVARASDAVSVPPDIEVMPSQTFVVPARTTTWTAPGR